MRRLFGLALLVLPLVASSVSADGFDLSTSLNGVLCTPPIPAYKLDAGVKVWLRGTTVPCNNPGYAGCSPGGCGPWYLYWPLPAHYQVPAMPHYPYWPPPQVLPGTAAALKAGGPANFHAPVTPVGYVPPYWYGQ